MLSLRCSSVNEAYQSWKASYKSMMRLPLGTASGPQYRRRPPSGESRSYPVSDHEGQCFQPKDELVLAAGTKRSKSRIDQIWCRVSLGRKSKRLKSFASQILQAKQSLDLIQSHYNVLLGLHQGRVTKELQCIITQQNHEFSASFLGQSIWTNSL